MNFSTLFRLEENLHLDKKTLVNLRWIAITGQLIAINFVYFFLELDLPIIETHIIISIGFITNIILQFKIKTNQLKDFNSVLFLVYDLLQLSILLYLTGGIFNPFIILILAPIIISASYLPAFWTILLCLYSLALILFINFNFISFNWNEIFITPQIYNLGILVALIITIIFIAIYVYLFSSSSRKISNALSEAKLQLSNQKKITEVAYLSAAAVHELSTPLNTIFLVLNDLLKEKVFIKKK